MELSKLKDSLQIFAEDLNKHNIKWALGGSLLLYFEGINTTVGDIDILVDENDYTKLLRLLQKYNYTSTTPNSKYLTKHFISLVINEVDFDIMLGFAIQTRGNLYQFPFKINKAIRLKDQTIYLSSINEWLLAYDKMGRDEKVKIIENHLSFKIETTRLTIEHMSYNDFDDTLLYMSDFETLRYESSPPYNYQTLSELFLHLVPSANYYSIKLKENNRHIGHIYFALGQPTTFKEYNIGYIINKQYTREGYCSEAAKSLIDYGFKNMGVHRVKAMCNPDNIASWRVMEKVGGTP